VVLVPAGRSELRITMNAIDDGAADFDLYVKRGSPPTAADYDCAQNGIGQFASCTFAAPEAGAWYVLVDRYAGGGGYQVTATSIGVDCSEPRERGLACDDGNSCTDARQSAARGVCAAASSPDGTACDDARSALRRHVRGGYLRRQRGAGDDCTGPASIGGQGLPRLADGRRRTPATVLNWRWLGGSSTREGGLRLSDHRSRTSASASTTSAVPAPTGPRAPHPRGAPLARRRRRLPLQRPRLLGDGIRRVVLREGGDGSARITIDARGANLAHAGGPARQQSTGDDPARAPRGVLERDTARARTGTGVGAA
jgi:hypothetical protein